MPGTEWIVAQVVGRSEGAEARPGDPVYVQATSQSIDAVDKFIAEQQEATAAFHAQLEESRRIIEMLGQSDEEIARSRAVTEHNLAETRAILQRLQAA